MRIIALIIIFALIAYVTCEFQGIVKFKWLFRANMNNFLVNFVDYRC